ncbi:Sulfotransferase family protein [Pedobacter steynii]|uniref:Sulfotransferase family protein n=1 Tax=Pedobacter steynii TaxID=430522 RepID=A0A1G9U1W0_9SPHI|nr:sulfotransferase [Pedobacter steynii]NQX40629.1 sulfotransferase [Pedobacter steynii]SDM53851.1 Sulfotransferase family protein [Pedobacter steynii]
MLNNGIQIIGTQRSGSNLLRVILDQSPEIASPHPPHILVTFLPLLDTYGTLDAVSYRRLVKDVVAYVNANPVPWDGVVLDEEQIFNQSETYHLFTLNRLIYEQAAIAKNAKYWCCKSMANVHYATEMEAFGLRPKYVFLYRDGRDVACSFKKAIVGEKHIYHLAQQWKKDQEACIRLREILPANRFFSLNYESLITAPEAEIRKLCLFLDIEYQPEMLQFHDSKTSKLTAAAGEMWSNLEKPIISNNTGKFLKEFKGDDLDIFELVAGEVLTALHYERYAPQADQGLIAEDRLNDYDRENGVLKQEALALARPADLENRAPQLQILKEIKSRKAS